MKVVVVGAGGVGGYFGGRLAAVLVASTLFITFDLDRPVRGLINVPADSLVQLRSSMDAPPAYGGPT